MTEKPEALRIADELTATVGTQSTYSAMHEAAAELRRLHQFAEDQIGRATAAQAALQMTKTTHALKIAAVERQRDALLKVLKDVLPVAEDASESLGRFCGDEGWTQDDMDRMDNVDGMLPLIRAAIKAVEGEKT